MDTSYYLDLFQKSADQFDNKLFSRHQLEVKVALWVNSIVLKIQKKSWANLEKPFDQGLFFSIWINDQPIPQNKLNYNIHALKLRELRGYSIKSREFAEAFRSKFKAFEKEWPNVSLDFGPQTLMEGWVSINVKDFGNVIMELTYRFLEIQHIIDGLLSERKKF